jgi:hypothetical protein
VFDAPQQKEITTNSDDNDDNEDSDALGAQAEAPARQYPLGL